MLCARWFVHNPTYRKGAHLRYCGLFLLSAYSCTCIRCVTPGDDTPGTFVYSVRTVNLVYYGSITTFGLFFV